MLLDIFIPALVTLFVILDPIGLMPIFAVMTKHGGEAYQRSMALRSTVVATIVLVLAFFFGDMVLRLFGITIPAFRIAGGVLLFATALEMIFEFSAKHRKKTAEEASHDHPAHEDISVVPLAFPLMAGPGAITTTILLSSSHQGNLSAQLVVVAALLIVMFGTYLFYRVSGRVMELLGETVTSVITRLLGVILAALAVQFIIDGVKGALIN
ncbi:MarC family protein [Govanella unica]|uniref:UPF0056 membrane protein n=1 Tax=Govanella unica TaxID=2975056 RepID=A0A9X3Z6R9_9PROT|nr:MarC family protein [Govania unica]MDA5193426.1 MarC family protein [Govania unica]